MFEKDAYDSSIQQILTMLDTDKSGTISLQEFKSLYPDTAEYVFERFDVDKHGELDIQEFKEFIDTDELATEILNRLNTQVIGFVFFNLNPII